MLPVRFAFPVRGYQKLWVIAIRHICGPCVRILPSLTVWLGITRCDVSDRLPYSCRQLALGDYNYEQTGTRALFNAYVTSPPADVMRTTNWPLTSERRPNNGHSDDMPSELSQQVSSVTASKHSTIQERKREERKGDAGRIQGTTNSWQQGTTYTCSDRRRLFPEMRTFIRKFLELSCYNSRTR